MIASFSLSLLLAWGLCSMIMTAVWWYQTRTRNAGIVDAWWSYNFFFTALLFAVIGSGDSLKKIICLVLVALWSLRLGTHLLIRNTQHAEEDSRYKKLREEYGERERFLMWRFFIFQATSNVILSLPFLFAVNQTENEINLLWIAGLAVGLVALGGESLADHQLKKFKAQPENKGKVCRQGLWNYSRHPNYFFEWLMWVAFTLLALESKGGWLAISAPLIMYYILNHVTGIPMLEELAVKTKGDEYRKYQQTTSSFFPWFKI